MVTSTNFTENNRNMGHEERSNRIYSHFRTSLDLGMGVLYLVIAGMILTMKYFGTMALDAKFAYILGGMMLAYGLFRIYRGIQGMRYKNRDKKSDFPDLYKESDNFPL
jgi:hypothetical protein